MMRHLQLLTWVLLSFAPTANAQSLQTQAEAVTGADFVRAFLGNCAQNVGNNERVTAAAIAMGFPPLPEELKPLMAPSDPDASFLGFVALEGDAAPYFLGVSSATMDGINMETCTVSNPYIETQQVFDALIEFVDLGMPDQDLTEMGQRYRLWETDKLSPGSFILLTDAEPMGMGGATLAISASLQN